MEKASENSQRSRFKRALKLSGALCLMIGALTYLFFGNTAVAQMWRLPKAQRHRKILEEKLAEDPRYQNIKISVFTADGGGRIILFGNLPSEADLLALKNAVDSTKPPVGVTYRVAIAPK